MGDVYHYVGVVMVRMTAKIDLMKAIVQAQNLRLLANVSNSS
jgi:GMP synthase PP-ATPase subunit